MFYTAAFAESQNLAAARANVAAVADQQLFTSGDDLRIPKAYPNLVGYAAVNGNTAPGVSQIQAPSLRRMVNIDVEPTVAALVFGSPPEIGLLRDNPIPLDPGEAMNFTMIATGGVATEMYGLVWLSDGPIQPIKGNIYTVSATAAVALAANAWVSGNLTLGQTLPDGTYQVVGMRARGTNLVAARLIFSGLATRPGVPAVNAIGDLDDWRFRFGNMGVFGEFDSTVPPTVECLGVTDSAQSFLLDLIKTG